MANIDKIAKVWTHLEENFEQSGDNSRLSFLKKLLGCKGDIYNTTALVAFMGQDLPNTRMQEFNDLRDLLVNAEKNCVYADNHADLQIINLDEFVRIDFTDNCLVLEDYSVFAEEHCTLEKAISYGFLRNAVLEKDGEIVNIMISDKRFLPLVTKEDVTAWMYNARLQENNFFQVIFYLLTKDIVAGSLTLPKIFITKDMFDAIVQSNLFEVSEKKQEFEKHTIVTRALDGAVYENLCSVYYCDVKDRVGKYHLTIVEV